MLPRRMLFSSVSFSSKSFAILQNSLLGISLVPFYSSREVLLAKGLLASLTLRSFGVHCSISHVGCRFRGLSMTSVSSGGLFVVDFRADNLALRRPPTVLGVPCVLDPSAIVDCASRSILPYLLSPPGAVMSRTCVSRTCVSRTCVSRTCVS
jgi:hypothetical protein